MPAKHHIAVTVKTRFLDEQSEPDNARFVFSYTIRIENQGEVPAQLISRHWVITDELGKVQEVHGEGVVGEQPHLRPGESFEYTSFCPLHSPYGNMRGKYQMIDEFGERFWVSVPVFFFRPPRDLEISAPVIQ